MRNSQRPVTVRHSMDTRWGRARGNAELAALQSRGVIVETPTGYAVTTRYMPYARYLAITVRSARQA